MLVLKRKEGESIVIGDNIEVIIGEIVNGSVKVSIKAPNSMKIIRKELLTEIKEENLESMESIDSLDFLMK